MNIFICLFCGSKFEFIYFNKCKAFITNLHGSIHFTAVKHEKEVVQVATCCLPGHIVSFFIEELGSPQSQSCVHYLCPENGKYYYQTRPFNICQQCFAKSMISPCKVKGIINNLSTVDHWNILKISKELMEEVEFF